MTQSAITPLRHEIGLGLFLMVLSVLISPIIDIFAKLAVTSVPATEITFVRLLFQMTVLGPICLLRGTLFDVTWRKMGLHATRGLLMAITMITFVTPLAVMEVADAIAIFFVEPIILTILGSIVLKETIGWRRYTACGVGFFGSLLVIQPSLQEVGPIALLPVVSAFSLALFFMLTRLVAQKEDPWSMQFYAGLWGGLFSGLLLLFGNSVGIPFLTPVMPDTTNTLYIAGAAVAATIAGVLGVYAYRSAPASTLAPLQYLEIVSATILGWWVFGHLPDAVKWLGIAIIIASGLYVIWRERQLNKMATTPPVSAPI
ncbi:EamA family transporter [Shinella kummerowiae]|jgi:S-adenosylmethionine uptake transporter|uniref:EamA family transporter n=1 Tax=Shinella kummerowiae TaxID=417745 RepID=A0A6N8S598_9HYPH|nr:DMT family transporter [Shinella kummerowiae]MXN43953.1 EamA family transporter [Shinella kummerowiae]